MRFGINVPIFGEYADPELLAELAVEAEGADWDGFWIWDHLQWSGEDDGEPRQRSSTRRWPWRSSRRKPLGFGLARWCCRWPGADRGRWPGRWPRSITCPAVGSRSASGSAVPPGLEFGDFGEDVDATVRAGKLDEGLDVLQGCGRGSRSTSRAALFGAPCPNAAAAAAGTRADLGWRRYGRTTRPPSAGRPDSTASIRCSSRWRCPISPPRSPIWSISSIGTVRPTGRSTSSSEPRRPATAVLTTFGACRASLRLASPGGWNRSPTGVGRSPRCATGSAGAPRGIPARSGRRLPLPIPRLVINLIEAERPA